MSRVVALRLVVFTAIAVHMQLGGLFEQVFHSLRPAGTMTWQMYSVVGHDVCEVQWTRVDDDGAHPIDRLAVLGYPNPHLAPDRVKVLHGPDGVRRAASELCRKLGDPDLRVDARCGSRSKATWVKAISADTSICDASASPRGKRKLGAR